MFLFSLQLLSETFLILRRNEWDMIKKYIGLHVKFPLFLSNFKDTWIFSSDFRKVLKYQISWKSVQWEPSCSMRTDRRTAMTNLIVVFRSFAKVLKNAPIPSGKLKETKGICWLFIRYMCLCLTLALTLSNTILFQHCLFVLFVLFLEKISNNSSKIR